MLPISGKLSLSAEKFPHTVLLSLIGLSFVTEKCAVFQNQVPYNDVIASAHYTKNGVFFSWNLSS